MEPHKCFYLVKSQSRARHHVARTLVSAVPRLILARGIVTKSPAQLTRIRSRRWLRFLPTGVTSGPDSSAAIWCPPPCRMASAA